MTTSLTQEKPSLWKKAAGIFRKPANIVAGIGTGAILGCYGLCFNKGPELTVAMAAFSTFMLGMPYVIVHKDKNVSAAIIRYPLVASAAVCLASAVFVYGFQASTAEEGPAFAEAHQQLQDAFEKGASGVKTAEVAMPGLYRGPDEWVRRERVAKLEMKAFFSEAKELSNEKNCGELDGKRVCPQELVIDAERARAVALRHEGILKPSLRSIGIVSSEKVKTRIATLETEKEYKQGVILLRGKDRYFVPVRAEIVTP